MQLKFKIKFVLTNIYNIKFYYVDYNYTMDRKIPRSPK